METPTKKEFPFFNRMHRVRRYHRSTEVFTYFTHELRTHNVQQCHWKIIYKMKGQNISSNVLIPHSHTNTHTHTSTIEMNERDEQEYEMIFVFRTSFGLFRCSTLTATRYSMSFTIDSICILFHFNNKSIEEMRANISTATSIRHIKWKRNHLRCSWMEKHCDNNAPTKWV